MKMEKARQQSRRPAILFDLDGTLIDSVYQYVLAWRQALERIGLSLAVWRIHRRIGMSGGLLAQALGREIQRPLRTCVFASSPGLSHKTIIVGLFQLELCLRDPGIDER